MNLIPSKKIQSIGKYAFAAVDEKVAELKAKGAAVIDFGVGDPTNPTPHFIREAMSRGAEKHATSGYPSYTGSLEYRTAVSTWMKKRFGVALDPKTEITSTIGSKEAVFNFPLAFVDPGDYVIIPSPGYPPYYRGTLFAGGERYYIGLSEKNGFLPDLAGIPSEVARKAKILWINYPNSPSGRVAPDEFFKEALEFCGKYGIILASDEAYSEIYFTKQPPRSALEFSKEGVVAFHSLSKRSAMTGYRIGWAAGDADIIAQFKKLKTNIDSGTANFVQEAAIAALSDEKHVAEMRGEYKEKRDVMVKALTGCGLPDCTPDATLYIWQKCPEGMNGLAFAEALLDPEIALVVTPGAWISETLADETNPGEKYVRLALCPPVSDCKEAAKRLSGRKFKASRK
jgi:LL-diaminopimelate aminotransferase